jgi:protein arginine kinase
MTENSKPHAIFCENKLWGDNNSSLWLASTINFLRNIEKYNFPGKLSAERRKQIVWLVSKELSEMSELAHPCLLKAEDLSVLQKEFLVEHFLTPYSFQQAGTGEAFILEDKGEFMATLNLRNHIQLELIDTQGDLENAWNKLVKIESQLGKAVNYSYSAKFGFLTADPIHCGTALLVTVFLQVSGLVHTGKIDEVLDQIADDNLLITGIQGSPTEIIGDVLAVQNNYTLGLTEENIISILRSFTTKILVEERACRTQIRQQDNPVIKDKISRAYAILIHSYQIEAVEALNAISLLKLGVDLGWIEGVTIEQLNLLFFNCRRAHLQCQFEQKIAQEETLHKRAEFIHKTLANVKLKIA